MSKVHLYSRLRNHYRRWRLSLSEPEQFLKFKHRLLTALNEELETFLLSHAEVDADFKAIIQLDRAESPRVRKQQIYVQPPKLNLASISSLANTFDRIKFTDLGFGDTAIYKEIDAATETRGLATATQILFWALERSSVAESATLVTKLAHRINDLGRIATGVGFRVTTRGKHAVLRPNGDPFLDSMIIDCVLEGIEAYPKADKALSQALTMFLRGDKTDNRHILDNLRFSLEQLLKSLLRNEKSLENQKEALGTWLKDKGIHAHIRSLYAHLVNSFSQYQNNAVKHNEDYSEKEVEFLIYLTGSLMRLLLELEMNSSSPEEASS